MIVTSITIDTPNDGNNATIGTNWGETWGGRMWGGDKCSNGGNEEETNWDGANNSTIGDMDDDDDDVDEAMDDDEDGDVDWFFIVILLLNINFCKIFGIILNLIFLIEIDISNYYLKILVFLIINWN